MKSYLAILLSVVGLVWGLYFALTWEPYQVSANYAPAWHFWLWNAFFGTVYGVAIGRIAAQRRLRILRQKLHDLEYDLIVEVDNVVTELHNIKEAVYNLDAEELQTVEQRFRIMKPVGYEQAIREAQEYTEKLYDEIERLRKENGEPAS